MAEDAMKPNPWPFHLQDEEELELEIKRKQNELLDLYSFYRITNLSWIKEELLMKAYELHMLDPQFTLYI